MLPICLPLGLTRYRLKRNQHEGVLAGLGTGFEQLLLGLRLRRARR